MIFEEDIKVNGFVIVDEEEKIIVVDEKMPPAKKENVKNKLRNKNIKVIQKVK